MPKNQVKSIYDVALIILHERVKSFVFDKFRTADGKPQVIDMFTKTKSLGRFVSRDTVLRHFLFRCLGRLLDTEVSFSRRSPVSSFTLNEHYALTAELQTHKQGIAFKDLWTLSERLTAIYQ